MTQRSGPPDADDTAHIVALARTAPDAALHALRTRVTDLGIAAEDILKAALEALIVPVTPAQMTRPEEAEGWLQTRYERAHALSLAISRAAPRTSREVASIISLEAEAGHFRAIGGRALVCLRMAAARENQEHQWAPSSPLGMGAWRACLGGVVMAMRGAVLVCATAEHQRARAVRQQALDAQAQTAALTELLLASIARTPEQAASGHHLIEVASAWRDILDHIAAICAEESGPPPPHSHTRQ